MNNKQNLAYDVIAETVATEGIVSLFCERLRKEARLSQMDFKRAVDVGYHTFSQRKTAAQSGA